MGITWGMLYALLLRFLGLTAAARPLNGHESKLMGDYLGYVGAF